MIHKTYARYLELITEKFIESKRRTFHNKYVVESFKSNPKIFIEVIYILPFRN